MQHCRVACSYLECRGRLRAISVRKLAFASLLIKAQGAYLLIKADATSTSAVGGIPGPPLLDSSVGRAGSLYC